MKDKKSFILYCDLIHTIEKLPNEKAGELFKIILEYVNDKNPNVTDLLLQIAFEPIKHQLKRDLIKWSGERVERVNSGKLGGIKSGEARRKKKQIEANEASALKSKQIEANEAVTVNATVTVTDTVIKKERTLAEKKLFDLAYFFELGYKWEICDLLIVALDNFLIYRSNHPDHGPIKSPEQVESILRGFSQKMVTDKDAVAMIEYTINRGAKNIIYELPKEIGKNGQKKSKLQTLLEANEEAKRNIDEQFGS